MTSIILAGGKSSRLGRNKALQVVAGKSLIQWVIDRLAIISTEIIMVTAHGEPIPCSSHVPVRTLGDIHPEMGPLGGIHSGLTASSGSQAIVVGCDTPFLNIGLLRYMAQICPTYDIVVPRIREMVEPLCAVYSKNCIEPIQELFKHNGLRIIELFAMVTVRYIEEDEIDRFDPEHMSFFNINSQADLDRARTVATSKRWLPTS
jgi:molybdenum cofactor guanylyltransferase